MLRADLPDCAILVFSDLEAEREALGGGRATATWRRARASRPPPQAAAELAVSRR